MFAPGLEHIVNCYVVKKLTTPVTFGMQWLKLQSIGGLAKLCFDFSKQ